MNLRARHSTLSAVLCLLIIAATTVTLVWEGERFMDRLLRGLSKFQKEVFPEQKHLFHQLAASQSPETLFLTCADSRVVPSLITQSDPGDLFICRNAGNMIPPYGEMTGGVSATIEYAVVALGVKHIIVCGHSDCGAMHGVLTPEKVRETSHRIGMVAARRSGTRNRSTEISGTQRQRSSSSVNPL
jgi:carbonic anhydrase